MSERETKSGHSSNTTNWRPVNVPAFQHRQIRVIRTQGTSRFSTISLKNMAGEFFLFSIIIQKNKKLKPIAKANNFLKSKKTTSS